MGSSPFGVTRCWTASCGGAKQQENNHFLSWSWISSKMMGCCHPMVTQETPWSRTRTAMSIVGISKMQVRAAGCGAHAPKRYFMGYIGLSLLANCSMNPTCKGQINICLIMPFQRSDGHLKIRHLCRQFICFCSLQVWKKQILFKHLLGEQMNQWRVKDRDADISSCIIN